MKFKNFSIRLFFLAVFVILFHGASFSQDCDYKVNKIDKFTKDTVLETSPVLFSKKLKSKRHKLKNLKCAALKNDTTFMKLTFTEAGMVPQILRFLKEVLLLTEKGEVIKLNFHSLIDGKGKQLGYGGYEWEVLLFFPNDSDITLLSKSRVTDIRLLDIQQLVLIEGSIEDKYKSVFSNIFKCVIN